MAQISLQPTEKTPVIVATAEKIDRLYFIDHMRTALVILVVLHHVAMVYGASAPFYYVEPPFTEPFAFKALLIFALANQAWFMGAFFLLSGYFTPGSYNRKGAGSFLKDRLVRLGIPLIIYAFVLNPIAELGVYLMPSDLTGITTPLTWESFWQAYPDLLGIGPLWFIALLLVFTFGYAAWRILTPNRASLSKRQSSTPGYLGIAIFILALAAVSFLVRRSVPLGQSVNLFVDALSFPTIAYLPQYLGFFVLGAVAYRFDWFRTLSGSTGLVGLVTALVAAVVLFPLSFSGRWFSLQLTEALGNAMGNGHWQSAAYALWDSAFAVGICLASVTFFRRFIKGRGGFGKFLSHHSYTVYIIHIPIIVLLAYALRGVQPGNLPKFALVAVVVVPTCFVVAAIIRKLPLASKLL